MFEQILPQKWLLYVEKQIPQKKSEEISTRARGEDLDHSDLRYSPFNGVMFSEKITSTSS